MVKLKETLKDMLDGTRGPAVMTTNVTRKRDEIYRNDGIVSNGGLTSFPTTPGGKSSSGVSSAYMNGAASSENGAASVTVSSRSSDTSGVYSPPASTRYHVPKKDFTGARHSVGTRELNSYVGFANIPNQVFRRAVKQGFDFTLMVVGASGLGKSTFINSLFLAEIYPSVPLGTVRNFPKTAQIESKRVKLVEGGVTLNLTLIDTPGFGDAIDNSKCWEPVIDCIDRRFGDYFTEESRVRRTEHGAATDTRVHCCLYFIQPTGHGLKPLDIEFMKRLHDRVNVIPVIAKADTMMADELANFKKTINREIDENGIKIYKFPEADDEEEKKEVQPLKDRVPFAIIGSNLVKEGDAGKKIRYRQYPWGTVEVDNLAHNDFVALRNMIIRTNMIDLIDVTKGVHYENFRCRQLVNKAGATSLATTTDKDPFTALHREKKEHELKLATKRVEMEKVFAEKLQGRTAQQKEKEENLLKQAAEYKTSLEAKAKQVEEKRAKLEELKRNNPQLATMDSRTSLGTDDSTKTKKKGFPSFR